MRERILGWFVYIALNRRKTVLVTCTIITLIAMVLASTITMNFKWDTLLPETMPVVKEYKRVFNEYPIGFNYIITVKSESTAEIETAIDAIIDKVEELKDTVITTYGRMEVDFMIEHGLRTIKPKDLRRTAKIFSNPALVPYLTHLNDDLEREFSGSDENIKNQERDLVRNILALEELVKVIDGASDTGNIDEAQLLRAVRDNTLGNPYYLSLDKKMGIVMVAVFGDVMDWNSMVETDRIINTELNQLRKTLPEVNIGTTGWIPLGRDEMESIGPFTQILTLVAVLLVFIALVWNYRNIVIPLLGMAPVGVGVVWSMGFYAVTVKQLNIFTSITMIVLIGLGIDFSIHMISRFYEERSKGKSLEDSLHGSIVLTGKGILTGGLTTAMAFLALQIGETKGVAELGFCAGSGVIITLISVFLILPSILVWRDRSLGKKNKVIRSRNFEFLGSIAESIAHRRYIIFPIIIILAVVAIFLVHEKLEYEYNLLELEPKGLESIDLQYEIIDRYKMSMEMAFLTTASIEEARKLEKKLKKKAVVGEVDTISLVIPQKDWIEKNDEIIAWLKGMLSKEIPLQVFTVAGTAELKEKLVLQIERLLDNMYEIEELSYIGGQDRVVAAIEQLTGGEKQDGLLVRMAERFEKNRIDWSGIEKLANLFSGEMKKRIWPMVQNQGPITEDMLPEKMLNLYKSKKTGRYLVLIYPKKNLFEREALMRFNRIMERISPAISGSPKLILLMNDAVVKDGLKALVAAFIVILILLYVDFRSISTVLLAITPLFYGALIMLGVMVLLGIKMNMVNVVVLAVIIGIGVDDGVHLMHRWRDEGVGGLKISAARVGHAILITSITTMIGFGSVGFYPHRGMASLGYVLFIGVGACFLTTILVLPAVASFLEKRIMKKRSFNK